MNTNYIKEKIKENLGKTVEIKVYGMRGKTNSYNGKIHAVYPNLFTIIENNLNENVRAEELSLKIFEQIANILS